MVLFYIVIDFSPTSTTTNARFACALYLRPEGQSFTALFDKAKKRKNQILFIDARQIGYMKDRVLRDFTTEDIAKIADTYHHWQQQKEYEDIAGFCYSASLDEVKKNDFVLTPGRYVGTEVQEDDGVPFAEKIAELTARLQEQFKQGRELEEQIKQNLAIFGGE